MQDNELNEKYKQIKSDYEKLEMQANCEIAELTAKAKQEIAELKKENQRLRAAVEYALTVISDCRIYLQCQKDVETEIKIIEDLAALAAGTQEGKEE
jgi:Fe2+ transport system protein B